MDWLTLFGVVSVGGYVISAVSTHSGWFSLLSAVFLDFKGAKCDIRLIRLLRGGELGAS